MNERIRELAQEATTKVAYYPDRCNGHPEYRYDFDEKKFAELIVRECIDVISPYAVRMENFDGGHPIADLKKHFGVEE